MNDSKDAKGKPPKPKPKPLRVVAVDHDYIKHGQTGGITLSDTSKDQ